MDFWTDIGCDRVIHKATLNNVRNMKRCADWQSLVSLARDGVRSLWSVFCCQTLILTMSKSRISICKQILLKSGKHTETYDLQASAAVPCSCSSFHFPSSFPYPFISPCFLSFLFCPFPFCRTSTSQDHQMTE